MTDIHSAPVFLAFNNLKLCGVKNNVRNDVTKQTVKIHVLNGKTYCDRSNESTSRDEDITKMISKK